jgi:hypothetical protein
MSVDGETPTDGQIGPSLGTADTPVGFTHGYSTTVDPAEYADDSAALQALNDRLLEHLPENFQQGVIKIPPLKPDGSVWTFPRTVTFGAEDSKRVVVPQGTLWGSGSTAAPFRTTIDDGSPVFYVPGDVAGGGATAVQLPIGGFSMAGGQGQDCEAIRLANLLLFKLRDLFLVHFGQGPESAGAVVFEGSCFNSEVDRVRYRGYNRDTDASRQTDVFAYREREDVLGPGEIVFGPGCRTRFGYGRLFDQREGKGNPSTFWYGHAERWERDYAMEVHTGKLHVGDSVIFGHPSDANEDAGVINVEGVGGNGDARFVSVAKAAQLGSPNGKPSLRLNGVPHFLLEPFSTFGHSDDLAVISTPTPPLNDSLVPNERLLSGTVDAPTEGDGPYQFVPADGG